MADNNFNKDMRLLSVKDFNYLKKNSNVLSSKFFRIFYKTSKTTSSNSRLGLAISKKVGKAHDRNLCKRIVRESFRVSALKDSNVDFLVTISPRLFSSFADTNTLKQVLRKEFDLVFNDLNRWVIKK